MSMNLTSISIPIISKVQNILEIEQMDSVLEPSRKYNKLSNSPSPLERRAERWLKLCIYFWQFKFEVSQQSNK